MARGGQRSWRRTPWRLAPHAVLALFCAGLVARWRWRFRWDRPSRWAPPRRSRSGRARWPGGRGRRWPCWGWPPWRWGWGGAARASRRPRRPTWTCRRRWRGTVVLDTPPVTAPVRGLSRPGGGGAPGRRPRDGARRHPPAGGPARSGRRRRWARACGWTARCGRRRGPRRPGGGGAGWSARASPGACAWRWCGPRAGAAAWRACATAGASGWRARAGAGLSGDRAALVRGMALGGGEGLSEEAGDAFRDAGLWHLLAVSGQNVAVVAIAVLALLGALGVRRRGAVAGAALVMCAYCLACDGGASVARAGMVGGAWAAGRAALGAARALVPAAGGPRGAAGPPAAGAVAIPGLQLSFAAVVGPVRAGPAAGGAGCAAGCRGAWPTSRRWPAAASLATAPVVVGALRAPVAGRAGAERGGRAAGGAGRGAGAGRASRPARWCRPPGVALAVGRRGSGPQALLWRRAAARGRARARRWTCRRAAAPAWWRWSRWRRWRRGRARAPRRPGLSPRRRAVAGGGRGRGRRWSPAGWALSRPGAAAAVAGAGRGDGARHRPGRRDPAAQPRGRGGRGRHRPARARPAPVVAAAAAGRRAPARRPGADPRLARPRGRGGGRAGAPAGGRACCMPPDPARRLGAARAGR